MTAPDQHDPWASLADSLGLPDRTEQQRPSGASSQPARPAAPPKREAKPRQDTLPDWNALASGLGLEPTAEPAKPHEAPRQAASRGPQAQEARSTHPPAESTPDHRNSSDDIAARLARAERLWDDDEPAKPVARRDDLPATRSPSRPNEAREPVSRELPRPAAAPGTDPAAARSAGERREEGHDDGSEGERRRGRRRGRRGGRGRSRSGEDGVERRSERRSEELPWAADELESNGRIDGEDGDGEALLERQDSAAGMRDEASGDDDASPRDGGGDHGQEEPRGEREPRGRGRRRGRRGRRGDGDLRDREPAADRPSRAPGERISARREDERPDRSDDDVEDADLVGSESLDTPSSGGGEGSDHGSDSDSEPGKKRRRRGRRGGRRRSKSRGEAGSSETAPAGEGEGDEPIPTGYVGGSAPRPQEGRRKRESAERSSDDRSRRRRGRGGEERPSARGRGRTFQPVSSSFSQDDEGLEYLGLDESDQHEQPSEPRKSQGDDDAVAESGLDAVRDVPSWVEAIGIVIAGNLDARSKSPSVEGGRPGRGRPGR